MIKDFPGNVFEAGSAEFPGYCLELFRFQYQHNPIYRAYIDQLGIDPAAIHSITGIPFLPIEFFKTQQVQTTSFHPEMVFESSGTSKSIPARHYVKDLSIYRESFVRGFEHFYGPVKDYCVIGLLPSYLERQGSSLVMMVDEMIRMSADPHSGFYLDDHAQLAGLLQELETRGRKTLLIGVTFALLDFAERFSMRLNHTIVMETGGMKGRRFEMTRAEVHDILKRRLGLQVVHSEYGMTELLSQAYSKGEGIFLTVPWMRVLVRNEDDPFDVQEQGTGIANIIDLANLYSCSFIATQDITRVFDDKSFEITGRVDNSDLRGCSLLVV
ncbi:MAG TPA: hypothetical protein VK543_15210 [Puia sp.]|nr:hypothetical protein [Puia sp.]